MKIKVSLEVSEQRIADLLCSGMEGGINYWGCLIQKKAPSTMAFRMDVNTVFSHIDYPMNAGGSITLEVSDGYDVKGKTKFVLTRNKLLKGLDVMARVAPRHFSNWLAERDDAETGDVFIQCALFGEIVFG